MEMEHKLAEELTRNPGQKAAQLAKHLNYDREEVNRVLNNRLNGQFVQDTAYKWWPTDKAQGNNAEEQEMGFSGTSLASLCQYYLACLGQDGMNGVRVNVRNGSNAPHYVALKSVPVDEINSLLQEPDPESLLSSMRRDRGTNVLYLGYPICINQYQLEPVLLLPIEFEQSNNRAAASVSVDYPQINTRVLERYSNSDKDTLMQDLLRLEDELGFSAPGSDVPELDEVAQKLYTIRKEWPWREACISGTLPGEPAIHELEQPGLYNRAVLVSAVREPFTLGLEHELRMLGKLEKTEYADTALGMLVNNTVTKDDAATDEALPLLEVLPMNTEQQQSIQRALTEPLTIITGPPGTGKSQVVTNLMVNAVWREKTILFASKNNKAVDVVEERVNALGPRPVLMRMGSKEYQQTLSDNLQALLSATADSEQMQDYDDALAAHHKLTNSLAENNVALDCVVKLRNRVDVQEQGVEYLREKLGNSVFYIARKYKYTDVKRAFDGLFSAVTRADKSQQKLFVRLFWPFKKKARSLELVKELTRLRKLVTELGLSAPSKVSKETEFQIFSQFAEQVEERLIEFAKIADYFQLLHKLQAGESLESLNRRSRQLLREIADNSNRLWRNWMDVAPSRLSKDDKVHLSKYVSAIKTVIGSSGSQTPKFWRMYYSLNEKVSHILSCWAVTSLSAKGKLPFTAGYYDLVVFDEASQCDIASALPLLYRAKRAVIIGDPQQLSHISRIKPHQDQQYLERNDLLDDYIQWAYSSSSLFEMARSYADGEDIVDLRDHHRSHADIINFSNKYFYEGRLRVATRYDRLKALVNNERIETSVRWYNIKGQTVRPNGGSYENRKEADAVIKTLTRLLLELKYPGSIGVVSPFRRQANLIRELWAQDDALQRPLDEADCISDTVHSFQGDERDIMIFSPVISGGAPDGALTFLKRNRNLFNVAITRARALFVVVGDKESLRNSGVTYLEKFADYVDQLSDETKPAITTVQAIEHGPNYPKSIDCSKVSEWEVHLYEALYRAGIKTIPQYKIDQYELDLAVIDGDRRLDIEVDGERYHRNWTGELCRRDQIRNQRLCELGWDVLRFWVYEVRDEPDICVNKVRQWLEM